MTMIATVLDRLGGWTRRPWLVPCILAGVLGGIGAARAQDSGRLLATGGVSEVEGAGGGGLTPWAPITGYGTRDSFGANAHATLVRLTDTSLYSAGVAVGVFDRLELSYDHQWFDTRQAGARLGLGAGYQFHLDVVGAKLRVLGDLVTDQDRWLPELSVGAQFKAADRHAVLKLIGARSPDGVDVYASATKLLLAQSLLLDLTVRATRANQFGLLGFGGDRSRAYAPEAEGSAALLLTRHLVLGAEFRTKPDNLRFAHEDSAFDAFVAWLPAKSLSVTLSALSLGSIARQSGQNGVYLSLQAGF